MQEMTSSTWKTMGSSIVWHPSLLADLVREIEPTPLRTVIGWLKTGFPENVPSGRRTVLVGGLQTAVETMMQTNSNDVVVEWLRQHGLATIRTWQRHWPKVGLVFVMDGPGARFEYNEGDDLIYFGRKKSRANKVKLSMAIWNGAASGAGAYELRVPGANEIGGYHVKRVS